MIHGDFGRTIAEERKSAGKVCAEDARNAAVAFLTCMVHERTCLSPRQTALSEEEKCSFVICESDDLRELFGRFDDVAALGEPLSKGKQTDLFTEKRASVLFGDILAYFVQG